MSHPLYLLPFFCLLRDVAVLRPVTARHWRFTRRNFFTAISGDSGFKRVEVNVGSTSCSVAGLGRFVIEFTRFRVVFLWWRSCAKWGSRYPLCILNAVLLLTTLQLKRIRMNTCVMFLTHDLRYDLSCMHVSRFLLNSPFIFCLLPEFISLWLSAVAQTFVHSLALAGVVHSVLIYVCTRLDFVTR